MSDILTTEDFSVVQLVNVAYISSNTLMKKLPHQSTLRLRW